MAANQARRRTDLDSMPSVDDGSQPQKAFIYQPLDPDPNAASVRLVLIEPSMSYEDPLSCRLIHVKFAEKPRYKALSYVWGDEVVKVKMLLDGAEFYVGQNLGDALHYLRRSGNQTPFWIDAICINQQDVEERNRQLAMMKWIYFRAQTVVIWLGKKYSRYQLPTKIEIGKEVADQDEPQKSGTAPDTTTETEGSREISGVNQDRAVKASNEEREMVKELCLDGYWDRLWIIQEIGRAHQKEVCFGNMAMDWNAFITMAKLHNSSCEGPLRLDRLLQEKYTGSHALRKLLRDHRKALCKEPRDKIYGLVGLAADAIEFPMDYRKSLLEVWKDTMEFMNQRGLLPESDIVPFGGLVKSLLIGADLGPLEQAIQAYETRPNSTVPIEDSDSCRVFQLHAYVVGCIMAVGPSTAEMISSLQKADQWAAEIQQIFCQELGGAHRENDTLMRAILETGEACLASICFSHVSSVRWRPLNMFNRYSSCPIVRAYQETIHARQSNYYVARSKTIGSPNDAQPAAGHSHLFLIKNCYRDKTPWKMGIASGLAQPGDLVCWIPGSERALVLRVSIKEEMLQIFGTALFTEDFGSSDKARHADRLKWFQSGEQLALKMDAGTIYVLLA